MSIILHPATSSGQTVGWHIEPGKPHRDWLSAHAFRCDPLLDANRSVAVLVLDEAIDAEWNGGPAQTDVIVHAGPATAKFGLGSVTLGQPWIWRTPRDRALLLGPPPNAEIAPWRMMDAWIDTTTLDYPWFPTLRFTEPGRHVIAAGTPIGAVREVVVWRGAPGWQEQEAGAETKIRQDRLGRVRGELIEAGEPGNLQWRSIARRKTSIKRLGHAADVLVADRWLDPRICQDLVDAFTPADAKWREGVDLWWPNLDDWPAVADALEDIGDAIEAVTHLPVKIENPHVVKWSPGTSMPVHIDVGGANEFPDRRWASVIYLVDLDDGFTHLPDRDITIQPRRGKMATWPGGHVPHGVDPSTEDRYTLIGWWGPACGTGTITATKATQREEKTR